MTDATTLSVVVPVHDEQESLEELVRRLTEALGALPSIEAEIILVDDGSCPAGQIKEVSGARMTPAGILRVQKCIPRLGPKKR